MRKYILPFLTGMVMLTAVSAYSQKITCKLTGIVIDRDSSKSLQVLPFREDVRQAGDEVPIVNFGFTHTLEVPFPEKYVIYFWDELYHGAARPIYFFAEKGTVSFKLYPTEQFDRNVIRGGPLTKEMQDYDSALNARFGPLFAPYYKKFDSLYKNDLALSDKARKLYDILRNTDDPKVEDTLYRAIEKLKEAGEYDSPVVTSLNQDEDSIKRVRMYWINDYIRDHVDLFSYSKIYELLDERYTGDRSQVDIPFMNSIYPVFAKKYPDHPYTARIGHMLEAINNIKVGSHFLDFVTETPEGKLIKLSDSIRGKVALIDLWASWCGSCRARASSMIPVWKKYHAQGFTVFAVAREFRDLNAFHTAMIRDAYPWPSYVEMDNKNSIWAKYNIFGSGGCTYLVDRDGKIVLIHPSAEEVEKLLPSLLK
jgi:thiol-disulfide isomerase/thioredoxin